MASPVEGYDDTSKATIKAKRSAISYLEATEIIDTNNSLIIWLCLTSTGNYRIHRFDWLKSILTAV